MLTNLSIAICGSRHWGIMPWLHKHFPEDADKVVNNPSVKDTQLDETTALISTYPLHVAAKAGSYINIEYARRPPPYDLSPEEMDTYGAHAVYYSFVRSLTEDKPEMYAHFVEWLMQQPIETKLSLLQDLAQRFA